MSDNVTTVGSLARIEPKPQSRMKRFGIAMWKTRFLHLLALPGLIYLAIFQYGPMYGVLMAFQNFRARDGIWGSEWVGFDQFIHFFNVSFLGEIQRARRRA